MDGKKVVVTTEHRGVFFGTLKHTDRDQRSCVLADARLCLYWSRNVRGFLGLAATGPDDESRVSPGAPQIELTGYTSIAECTDEAIAAWEAAPWG